MDFLTSLEEPPFLELLVENGLIDALIVSIQTSKQILYVDNFFSIINTILQSIKGWSKFMNKNSFFQTFKMVLIENSFDVKKRLSYLGIIQNMIDIDEFDFQMLYYLVEFLFNNSFLPSKVLFLFSKTINSQMKSFTFLEKYNGINLISRALHHKDENVQASAFAILFRCSQFFDIQNFFTDIFLPISNFTSSSILLVLESIQFVKEVAQHGSNQIDLLIFYNIHLQISKAYETSNSEIRLMFSQLICILIIQCNAEQLFLFIMNNFVFYLVDSLNIADLHTIKMIIRSLIKIFRSNLNEELVNIIQLNFIHAEGFQIFEDLHFSLDKKISNLSSRFSEQYLNFFQTK